MILGVIPARFASTRLFAKPLADIEGKPMIQHTWESASKSKLLDRIIIAVDDTKVESVVKSFKAEVMMTPKDIATGSDRIAYVAKQIKSADIIVNIQGDEPFIPGAMIDQALEPLLFGENITISTLAKKITQIADLKNPSIVKVVFDYYNNALYFSRSTIPFVRDAANYAEKILSGEIYKHIGLYVFRREALVKFTSHPPTTLEQLEKLEQLRMLELGMKIKVVLTEFESISVDTPDDLNRARAYFRKLNKIK